MNWFNTSYLYEQYYIAPDKVGIVFPQKKKNLVLIVAESIENTFLDKDNGGAFDQEYIPELHALAEENTNFSHNGGIGGPPAYPGTGWTIAALTAIHAGIPLNVPIDGNSYSGYGRFLPGAAALGDILEKQGYRQMFIAGSDMTFGGRRDFFTLHGKYEIRDLLTAPDDGIISPDYHVWWGFEDKYLFEYAKKELAAAERGQPFNMTLLTVDSHFPGGYVCDMCPTEFKDPYANVIACTSRQIADFITWLREQPYYKDTVIVVLGDHPSMDADFFKNIDNDYVRTTYNVIINSPVKAQNTKNRVFSEFDFFPTILTALGAHIEGERLGLGVNLYSGKRTLAEIFGEELVFKELVKRSAYYENELLYEK